MQNAIYILGFIVLWIFCYLVLKSSVKTYKLSKLHNHQTIWQSQTQSQIHWNGKDDFVLLHHLHNLGDNFAFRPLGEWIVEQCNQYNLTPILTLKVTNTDIEVIAKRNENTNQTTTL